ncbi:MAG: CaiB/BaiF CoA transferase family protein, partial [Pollutimonas bauzanensis]
MSSTQPLAGYVVVEIGHSVAAPYAGLVLAELGAEVIKVENPDGGDSARGWGPPFIGDMASIAVDLGDPDQRDALKALIADRADVVICNLRAGSADKLGLGSEALTAAKPALVYCELGAFGAGGPLSHKPGYDPLMQAYCGVMSVTGESAERPPVRVGVSMVDMGAGLWSAIGILASLLARKQSGKGCRVETSLFETAVAWVATPMARHLMGGGPQLPQGSGAAGIVPYQAFRTQTG